MIVSVSVLGFYPDHGPKVLVRPLEAVKNLQIRVGLKLAVFFSLQFLCYLLPLGPRFSSKFCD